MAAVLATSCSYATNTSSPAQPHIKGARILPDVQGYTAFPLLRAKRIPANDPVTMARPPQSILLMTIQADDCPLLSSLSGVRRQHAKPMNVGIHSGKLIQKILYAFQSSVEGREARRRLTSAMTRFLR